MIKVKSIVEIIYECDRKDMDKEFQKKSLTDMNNYCSSALKEELKSCLGDGWKVHMKSVEVSEE
jgi:hypothetical protein